MADAFPETPAKLPARNYLSIKQVKEDGTQAYVLDNRWPVGRPLPAVGTIVQLGDHNYRIDQIQTRGDIAHAGAVYVGPAMPLPMMFELGLEQDEGDMDTSSTFTLR